MKNRILSIALALCMVAVVFVSVPTKGEIFYTGSVQTTDDTGELKDVFFQGDHVYVNVELYYDGALTMDNIRITIEDQDGDTVDVLTAITNEPIDGYYNSSDVDEWLVVNPDVAGDMTVCTVIVEVNGIYEWEVFASTQIIVKKSGLVLEPDSSFYYPGQDVTITVLTGETGAFSIEIINETHHLIDHWDFENAVDGSWSTVWTIPEDAKDGTYRIGVTWEATSVEWDHDTFEVAMYYLMVERDRAAALPGESVTVDYRVLDMATMDFYTDVNVEWTASWFNDTGVEINATGELSPSYDGSAVFTIPTKINLTSDYDITFWANDSDDRSQEWGISFSVGKMEVSVETDYDTYLAGEKVVVDVAAALEYGSWSTEPLPGADVEIVVEKNGVVLDDYGASDMTTGVEGMVEHEFVLATDAEVGTYLVSAIVSKVGTTMTVMTSFEIGIEGSFTVDLDLDHYWSGQTATITFETTWAVDKVTGNSIFYMIVGDHGVLEAKSTNMSSLTYMIPADYVGDLYIEAYTIVNGYMMGDSDSADVAKAFIAVAANEYYFSGGDVITWTYQIATAMANGSLSYEIIDSSDEIVASGVLDFQASGSFTYNVPEEMPSSRYTATITLKDGQGNNVDASATTYLMNDYELSIWVESSSKTVSGAFEPGNMVTFGYSITTNGASHLAIYRIWFSSDMEDQDWSFLTSTSSGTFTIEVPDKLPDGAYEVWATLYDGAHAGGWLSSDWTPISVESNQGLWDKNVAGMSMTDFTIMLLLVVMIVLLIVVPFAKGRMGAPKPKRPEPVTHTPPPPEEPAEPQ